MTSGYQERDEQNGMSGRASRQPFTYSTDLYDNLGHGEDDTTRRARSDLDLESPPPNYSNGSIDVNSQYNDYHSGNGNNSYSSQQYNHNSHDSGYHGHQQQFDSNRGNLRAGNNNTNSGNHSNQQKQARSNKATTAKRVLPSDRLYQPRYLIERAEKRQAQKESEQVEYDTAFHANLPKNLGHVTSRFQDPYYQKSPRAQNEQPVDPEEALFRAKPPRQLEHVGSRHLNEDYFKKKEPKTENPDRHQTEFHARLPESLQYVQSRILDPKYLNKEPPPDYHEQFDTTFKARLPKRLEHVQSRILDPTSRDKSRAADHTEEPLYKPEFKAKPPKHLEQIEKRIYDPRYFQPKPKPKSPIEEDVFSHEFKSRPPKSLASIESRILEPRYFRKKSPVLAPIRPEDELKTNFKSKPPKDLEYIQSRVYDPKYFHKIPSPSQSQSPKQERRGPVAIIKVKPDKKAEIKPPGNSYTERLAMKKAEEESYYEVWHKQFQEEVKRKVRSNPETPKTVIAVENEDKRVKKFNKKHPVPIPPIESLEHRPVQSQGDTSKKPRMPWLKRKKKVSTVDRGFFDKWINIPEDLIRQNNDSTYKTRKSVPDVWTNDYNNNFQQPFASARRPEYVGDNESYGNFGNYGNYANYS